MASRRGRARSRSTTERYRDVEITCTEGSAGVTLEIGGQRFDKVAGAAGERCFTPLLPYTSFASPMDLAKALVDNENTLWTRKRK